MSTSHVWTRNNPRDILEIGYKIRSSVSFWTGVVEGVVVGPHLLPGRLTAQRYSDFLENVLPGCFKMFL